MQLIPLEVMQMNKVKVPKGIQAFNQKRKFLDRLKKLVPRSSVAPAEFFVLSGTSFSADQQFFTCITDVPSGDTMAQPPPPLLADPSGHQSELMVSSLEYHTSCIPVPAITAFHIHINYKLQVKSLTAEFPFHDHDCYPSNTTISIKYDPIPLKFI